MQKQTNSAPVPPVCPWLQNSAPEILKGQLSDLSVSTVSFKNLLFEQWIKKESHSVNISACTKLYIKFLINICDIFMIIFKNYFWNLLSCPR